MKSVLFVISVMVDENNEPVAGSEEAIGLLTNPLAIDEALSLQKERRQQKANTMINCFLRGAA